MILSGWESVFFWIFSIAAILAGLLTVMARNAVHSALFLISSLVSVAALFILLGAEFIAGVQILVYVGGVMVLFLFVIMLVNVGAEEEGRAPIFNGTAQVTTALVFLILLAGVLVAYAIPRGFSAMQERDKAAIQQANARRDAAEGSMDTGATGVSRLTRETERVGTSLYTTASLPFEIASLLLLVAIIGSVMLARTLKQEVAAGDVDPESLRPSAETVGQNRLMSFVLVPAFIFFLQESSGGFGDGLMRKLADAWTSIKHPDLSKFLVIAAILFIIGVAGVLTRRNLLVIFMSIELILNAANLNFIAFSRYLQDTGRGDPMSGQLFTVFVIVVAAAEAAIGLGIVIALYRNRETIWIDEIDLMKW
jgi:NADH:ubiquinone oxidoreductase subunit K/NADH:ubiquinone oxidoreductase subunit 6 (subunit J)